MPNENDNNITCGFHALVEQDQQKLFSLMDKRVSSVVFNAVLAASVVVFGLLVTIQFNMISSFGAKVDALALTVGQVEKAMIKVEGKVDNFGIRFDNFEKYNERELARIKRDVEELKR